MPKNVIIEIKATAILAHILKAKTPYPLPPEYEIIDDLPIGVKFDEGDWCSVTKAAFSRVHGVQGNQVTRWVQAGMPETDDGRIVMWEGEAWLQRERPDWWENREQRIRTEMRLLAQRLREEGNPLAGITEDDLVPDPEPEPQEPEQ